MPPVPSSTLLTERNLMSGISESSCLRAVIFDFDGVIVDSEPLHLAGFQHALSRVGITLTAGEYHDRYLALDDKGCFACVLTDRGRTADEALVAGLIAVKSAWFDEQTAGGLPLLPGAADFVRRCAASYPCAVASGALRHEIENGLRAHGLSECFVGIVAAEDVGIGKPNPEPFLKALKLVETETAVSLPPSQALVVEDSLHGVAAAHAAGMKCLAVANSYAPEALGEADLVVGSLMNLPLERLEALF